MSLKPPLSIDPGVPLAERLQNQQESLNVLKRKGIGFQPVTFENGWKNFAGWGPAAYMRDVLGFVHLRGLIEGGTVGIVPAFTVPEGFRPAEGYLFPTYTAAGVGRITVLSNGQVMVEAGSSTWSSLSGITYLAEK